VQCRRAENRRRSEAWRSRPRGQGNRKLAEARSIMVGVIPMLTALLASLAGVEGFKAYDCSNSSNPVDMYSLAVPARPRALSGCGHGYIWWSGCCMERSCR
jgi:hypothetical protein